MLIKSKREFYELAQKGLCGNTPRMWESFEDWIGDMEPGFYKKYWGIRSKAGWGHVCHPKVGGDLVIDTIWDMPEGSYMISEIPPEGSDTGQGLQGELAWMNGEWVLYYTYEMGYMREKLASSGAHARGWKAMNLLRGRMPASDFDMLMELFEKYSDGYRYPVIEFAVCHKSWGVLNRNTIIWEIRGDY